MQLASRNGCLLWPAILLLLGMCHGKPLDAFDEVHDESEKDAWLAGVYTPQPLKSVPWQAELPTLPTDGLHVPSVGEVLGLRGYKIIKGRPIDAYLGIRYAQVTSGLGRFQQAKPVPYQTRINAKEHSANCAQFPELQRLQEAEARGENVDDCLTLDIYTPAGARDLPVLVFVHGEMLFDGGSEEAQPDYLLEHDVILVSINYRLAPFGFLSALSDQLPGNVALSDLHLALEWLQRNLRYFGGASDQVTLVGQAGGATLAHALSLSPKTQHLFQQLILQSGSALNPYLIDERPLDTLATFAELARCPNATRNLSPLYECIRRLRTSQLVGIFEQLLLQNEPRGLGFLGGFKLVVGDRLGYLPEHPAALVASNSVNNRTKPMIVGATKDASAFILSRIYNQIEGLQSHNLSDYINVVLRHVAPPQHHQIWHDWAVREIFTPEQARYANARSVAQGLLELSNLIMYRAPVIDSIRGSYKKSPVYLYVFDYRGEHHRFGFLKNPLPFSVDASLSDDSVYLFPYPLEASNLNPEDKSLARALVAMWVNFAQTGIPNSNANVWPKITSEYGPFLRFTNSKMSILELDQHFGEGIYIPNLYPQYFNTTSTNKTTTTTTTTTRRPYQYVPYQTNRQPQQPNRQPQQTYIQPQQPQQPNRQPQQTYIQPQQPSRQPQQPILQPQQPGFKLPQAYHDYYPKAQAQRREQMLREQQERELQERLLMEQAQQSREILHRQEEERKREQLQREEELRREQLQQVQLKHEQEQREQQEREQAARQLQEQHEQQEREQARREHEMRQQQEREQQQREQQEREQYEREQQGHEEQPEEMPESNEDQEEREQQEREQAERDQAEREQQQREQQHREQLAREQQEREQQPHRSEDLNPKDYDTYDEYVQARLEQQQREEQEREQQERSQEESDQEAKEQQEREQQQREQLEREQQEREQHGHLSESEYPNATPTYEDYYKQQREQQEREQQEREQQEAREQQERDQQQREQFEREQQEREQQGHLSESEDSNDPSTYEDYVKQQREQQEREQHLRSQEEHEQEAREQEREQQEREQQEREQEPEPHRSDSDGPQDPSAYATYDDYLLAYNQWVEERNTRYNEDNNVSAELEEPEEGVAPIDDPHAQPNYGSQQYPHDDNNPQRIKLMRSHQRTRSLRM